MIRLILIIILIAVFSGIVTTIPIWDYSIGWDVWPPIVMFGLLAVLLALLLSYPPP